MVYDPLVTVDANGRDYTTEALRAESVVLTNAHGVKFSIPFGGPLHPRPIRWEGRAVAMGTIQVIARIFGVAAEPEYRNFVMFCIHAVDVELWAAASLRANEDPASNQFPATLDVPKQWRTDEFAATRRLFRRRNDMSMEAMIFGDFAPNAEPNWIPAFCSVPGYEFFAALPNGDGDAWLRRFDETVMVEPDDWTRDRLRDEDGRLIVYKCGLCGSPATHMILETRSARCAKCASQC